MAISLQGVQPPQATTSIHPVRGIRSQIRQDVQALSTALESGDLSTAQKSFGDLQKLLQSNGAISQASTPGTAPSGPLDAIKSDFQALGQALQSGDLAGAQKDYAQLATDSQQILAQQGGGATGRAGGRHHHPKPASGADNDGDSDGSGSHSSSLPGGATSASSSSATAQVSAFQFSVSASSDNATPSPFGQIKDDFQTIGQDLQSGNVSGLQKDISRLVTDAQQLGGQTNGTAGTSSPSASSAGLSAYQYSLSASYESASASSNDGTVDYQGLSLQGSFKSVPNASTDPATAASDQPPQQSNAYQISYQRISYLG